MVSAMIVLGLVGLLAFANGANDNCKGVATLVGFGAATPRGAMIWAALTTAAGAGISFFLAGGLIKSFSTGLFAQETGLEATFFIAVLIGAVGWIVFATFTGLPVSTTHAIMGGLLGAGLVSLSMGQIRWAELGSRVALPLVLSPLLSMLVVYGVSWPVNRLLGRWAGRCMCVVEDATITQTGGAGAALPLMTVVADTEKVCADQSPAMTISTTATTNAIHWASGGLVGFARGWNDAPKIAALSIGALAAAQVQGGMAVAFAVVTLAMAAGGLLAGRRVLETLSRKVTPLPLAESLTASMTTALLVSCASWFGMPVSTTHVSTGAIVGAGVRSNPREVKWGKVRDIVMSWVVTLPVAAIMAASVRLVL